MTLLKYLPGLILCGFLAYKFARDVRISLRQRKAIGYAILLILLSGWVFAFFNGVTYVLPGLEGK